MFVWVELITNVKIAEGQAYSYLYALAEMKNLLITEIFCSSLAGKEGRFYQGSDGQCSVFGICLEFRYCRNGTDMMKITNIGQGSLGGITFAST